MSGFDDFSFDNDSSFGDGFDDGFSDGFGEDTNSGFDNASNNAFNDGDTSGNGFDSNGLSLDFDDGTSNEMNNFEDDGANITSKKAIILIIVGIVVLIGVFLLIKTITQSTKNKNSDTQVQTTVEESYTNNQQPVQQQPVQQQPVGGQDASEVMSQGVPNTTVVEKIVDNGMKWQEIVSNEPIQFNTDYIECTFTITDIKHYARAVDVNDNLVVKSTISGNISGLSGTYSLDIPYVKGCKLGIGDSFSVMVQLGQYNGKSVVGEISY